MCKDYTDLEFTHFVVTTEGTVFGSARLNGNGKTYNFLICDGSVRTQSGNDWVELDPEVAELVKGKAQLAYATVPTYRTSRLLTN